MDHIVVNQLNQKTKTVQLIAWIGQDIKALPFASVPQPFQDSQVGNTPGMPEMLDE